MDSAKIDEHLRRQDQVIARRQVLDAEVSDDDIERMLRRRQWARVHAGVYVAHTGPLSWRQRAWAAVLVHWPSALDGHSALSAHGMRAGTDADVVEVVVARHRRVHDPPGVRTRRVQDFDAIAQLHLSPPRVRVEHAVLRVASRARTEDGTVAVLSDACQEGRTTAARLLDTLVALSRLPRRALIREVLEDVANGAYSALERRYLVRVERPHGLPVGQRQTRATTGARAAYRDVSYDDERTVVELDGRLGHEQAADRWADLERDVAAAVEQTLTVRISWRQVLAPCRVAGSLARILQNRGWSGVPTSCGPDCSVGREGHGERDSGGSSAPSADDPPLSVA